MGASQSWWAFLILPLFQPGHFQIKLALSRPFFEGHLFLGPLFIQLTAPALAPRFLLSSVFQSLGVLFCPWPLVSISSLTFLNFRGPFRAPASVQCLRWTLGGFSSQRFSMFSFSSFDLFLLSLPLVLITSFKVGG